MESRGVENIFRCPCCEDNEDYKKIVYLKDAGLIIYRQATRTNEIAQSAITTEDVVILHNTKNAEIISVNVIPTIEQNKISCPRCKKIIENAQRLLTKIPRIKKNGIMGVCAHCLKKTSCNPCSACEMAVDNFIIRKDEMKNTKHDTRMWLSKIQRLLIDVAGRNNICQQKRHTLTSVNLKKMHFNSPISIRVPEVADLFNSKILEISSIKTSEVLRRPYSSNPDICNVKKKMTFNYSGEMRDGQLLGLKAIPYFSRSFEDLSVSINRSVYLRDLPCGNITEQNATKQIFRNPSVSSGSDIINRKLNAAKTVSPFGKKHSDESVIDNRKYKQKVNYHQRKYYSEEALITSLSDIVEDKYKDDFGYFFPHEVYKASLKKRISSSELIKVTQDMLQARIEEKKIKLDVERRLKREKLERRRFAKEEKRKQAREQDETQRAQDKQITLAQGGQRSADEKQNKVTERLQHKITKEGTEKKRKISERKKTELIEMDKRFDLVSDKDDVSGLKTSGKSYDKPEKNKEPVQNFTASEKKKETLSKKTQEHTSNISKEKDGSNFKPKEREIPNITESKPQKLKEQDHHTDSTKKDKKEKSKPKEMKENLINSLEKDKVKPTSKETKKSIEDKETIKTENKEIAKVKIDVKAEDEFRKLVAEQAKLKEERQRQKTLRQDEEKRAKELAEKKLKEKDQGPKSADIKPTKKSEVVELIPQKKQEKNTAKDLDVKQIKVRVPSGDDLILQLVKLKKTTPKGQLKPTPGLNVPKLLFKHKEHRGKDVNCLLCTDSDIELDIESIAKKKEVEENIADIIIGPKIFKYNPSLPMPTGQHKEQPFVPIVVQSNYKENIDSFPVTLGASKRTSEEKERKPIIITSKGKQTVSTQSKNKHKLF